MIFDTPASRKSLAKYLALYATTGVITYKVVPAPKEISKSKYIIDWWTFWHVVYGFVGYAFGQTASEHFTLAIANEFLEYYLRGKMNDQFLAGYEPMANAVFDVGANMLGWKLGELMDKGNPK